MARQETARQQEIEDTRQTESSASFMDQLILRNEQASVARNATVQPKVEEEVFAVGVSSLIQQQRRARKSEELEKERQEFKDSLPEPKPVKEAPPAPQAPVISHHAIMDMFLQNELNRVSEVNNGIEGDFESVYSQVDAVPTISVNISAPTQPEEEADDASDADSDTSLTQPAEQVVQGPQYFDIAAGDMMYAILLSSINSDTPGPVLAQIVDGGVLDGAKLLGAIEVNDDNVRIAFSSINVDGYTYPTSTIAVDLSTDQTAMADNVDRHIVERYGSLALASFLGGYADALQNTTTTTALDGTTTTTTSSLPDSKSQLRLAAGRVGEAFVPALEENFNRPPTITLQSGRALGVLFLEGLNL